jgi:GrpB-like predicted nucleotidyltransferase (UPF0157 family)
MSQLLLLEYQDTWPGQFRHVAAELLSVFAPSCVSVEHIGSTAVLGLCAKPVLDVLVGLDKLSEAEDRQHALASVGYIYRAEYEAQLPERRYFVRAEAQTLRVHLHCVLHEGRLWHQHIAFRNLLRRCPEVLSEYAALKRNLALVHAENKSAYTEAKAPFITRVMAEAAGAA